MDRNRKRGQGSSWPVSGCRRRRKTTKTIRTEEEEEEIMSLLNDRLLTPIENRIIVC
jgi:hypothetical protein